MTFFHTEMSKLRDRREIDHNLIKDWHKFNSPGINIDAVTWIGTNTTGQFFYGLNCVAFADDQDAMLFKLRFG